MSIAVRVVFVDHRLPELLLEVDEGLAGCRHWALLWLKTSIVYRCRLTAIRRGRQRQSAASYAAA
jgi:hypothetical protein